MLKKKPNAAAQAFRYAANTLQRNDHWLDDYFRRIKTKGGNKYAIVAASRKLAIIYYKVVRLKQPFQPFDKDEYKKNFKELQLPTSKDPLARLKGEAG